jgi:hypothetical protein
VIACAKFRSDSFHLVFIDFSIALSLLCARCRSCSCSDRPLVGDAGAEALQQRSRADALPESSGRLPSPRLTSSFSARADPRFLSVSVFLIRSVVSSSTVECTSLCPCTHSTKSRSTSSREFRCLNQAIVFEIFNSL